MGKKISEDFEPMAWDDITQLIKNLGDTSPEALAFTTDMLQQAGHPARVMAGFRTLDDAELRGKRVLLRLDLNVPTENGQVTDATRLERVAPTIREIADKGGKVILLSHFGRPKGRDPKNSLKPVAAKLAEIIGRPVGFRRRLHRPARRSGGQGDEAGRDRLPGEHALSSRGREERSRLRRAARRSSATSMSTTPSPPRTARMPRPKGWRTSCPPMPAAPCRPSWRRCRRRWKIRSVRWPPSSAARKFPPSSTCSATCSRKSMC